MGSCPFCGVVDGQEHIHELHRGNAFDDTDRLKALWLYPPDDVGLWRVAYPTLDAFRVAIDRYTKKKQDEKWEYPS